MVDQFLTTIADTSNNPAFVHCASGQRAAASESGGHFAQLIFTLGLSLVISNVVLIFYGSSPRTVQSPLAASSWTLGPFGPGEVMLFINKARAIGGQPRRARRHIAATPERRGHPTVRGVLAGNLHLRMGPECPGGPAEAGVHRCGT